MYISSLKESAQSTVGELQGDGRGWILLFIGIGWFLSIGVRLVFPILIPHFRVAFDMSLTIAATLLTILWVGYALGQLPGGVLGDNIGDGAVLLISVLLTTVTVVLLTIAPNVPFLLMCTLLFGFATGLFGTGRFVLLTRVYSDKSGTAIGLTMAAGNVGNTVLPVIAGLVAAYATWRYSFGILIPLFVLTTIGFLKFVPRRTETKVNRTDSTLSRDTIKQVLTGISKRNIILITVIQILLAIAFQGFTGFYPTYLIEAKGFTSGTSSALFGLFFGAGIVAQPATGISLDRLGAKRSLLIVLGVLFLSFLVLPRASHPLTVAALTILFSGLMGITPITQPFLIDALPKDVEGSGLGLIRTVYIMIGASGPLFVGVLFDHQYFNEAFLIFAVVSGISILLCLLLPDSNMG